MDKDGGLAAIGTLLRIERHSRFSDGKLLVQNLGAPTWQGLCARFRLTLPQLSS